MAAKQCRDCPMRINRLRPICKTERGPTRALIRIHARLLVAALAETSGGHGVETLLMSRFVSKDSDQVEAVPRKFKLGPLGNLNQVTKGLAKTIRAMGDGTLDSQVGARICNGLGIMRACLETQKLEQLEARIDEIAHRVARDRTNGTSTHEAQRLSN